MDRISIIITDDKVRYRNVIKELLPPDLVRVVGEADNGKQLLGLLEKLQPDIVLLDLDMPVMDGNQAFKILSKKYPQVKVIILSYYSESVLMDDYIGRGAKGFISKETLDQQILISAIRQVKKGEVFTHNLSTAKKIFSPRQKEILPLIFDGMTNEEIAGEVCITKRAVEKQRFKIYQKSGAKKVIDFYKYAFTRGLQFLGRVK